MNAITEGARTAAFLLSEANGKFSRDNVAIAAGELAPGTVLGRVTATGKYVQFAPGAADGSETVAGILYAAADASAAEADGVAVVRQAELKGEELIWPEAITAPQKTAAVAALAVLGLIIR